MEYLDCYRDESLFLTHSCTFPPFADRYGLHAHEFYEILYLTSGRGNLFVEGHDYSFIPGCLVLFRTNEAHYLTLKDTPKYQRIALHFNSGLLEGIDPAHELLIPFEQRELGCKNLYIPDLSAADVFKRSFDYMLQIDARDPKKRIAIVANLIAILYELTRLFEEQKEPEQSIESADSKLIAALIEYINQHLFEEITIEELCQKFFVSRAHLHLIFKKTTSTTPWNYIMMKRLIEARKMLRQGKKTGEVSALCGFRDYSSFYRAYKKYFHVSPSEDKPIKP